MHYFEMSHYDYMFFISMNMMVCFSWFVFFFYGSLALKGLTIIEAADRFSKRKPAVREADQVEYEGASLRMIANKKYIDNLEVIFGTRSVLRCFLPVKRPLIDPLAFQE